MSKPDDSPEISPSEITVLIQWGDQDAFGHVNNIHYLKWFESGRVAYLAQCGVSISNHGIGPILASVSCNYIRQIMYPDTIKVETTATRIGRTSITLAHKVWSERLGEIAAEGSSVVVIFDYEKQTTHPVPDDIRKTIENIEG